MLVSVPLHDICHKMQSLSEMPRARLPQNLYEEHFQDMYHCLMQYFFDKDNISRSMTLLMSCDMTPSDDSISKILYTMCTSKVGVNLSQGGFVPFKAEPLLIIPYDKMTPKQLKIIHEAIMLCKSNYEYTSCSQMGGGVSIFLNEPESIGDSLCIIQPALVMYGLYVVLKENTGSRVQHSKLYSILIQRLTHNTHILPEEVQECKELCAAHVTCSNSG